MKEEKMHTPGPWYVGYRDENIVRSLSAKLVEGDDGMVAATYRMNVNQKGNALLIAAAPEMLEALRAMVAAHQNRVSTDGEKWVMQQARAAIAKAEDKAVTK
jgi:hypothetical protein